jgi:hypothetical protein
MNETAAQSKGDCFILRGVQALVRGQFTVECRLEPPPAVPEWRLKSRRYTIRNPDGLAVAFEPFGGRWPGSNAEFSLANPLQVPATYEQADRASSVKLQVTVEGSDGELVAGVDGI